MIEMIQMSYLIIIHVISKNNKYPSISNSISDVILNNDNQSIFTTIMVITIILYISIQ